MLLHIESTLFSQAFRREVEAIRRKYEIPKDGFPTEMLDGTPTIKGNLIFHKGIVREIPNSIDLWELEVSVLKLAEEHNLEPSIWDQTLLLLVLYNQINPDISVLAEDALVQTYNLESLNLPGFEGYYYDDLLERSISKPIAILVSPYISKTDLLDFVSEAYDREIAPLRNATKGSETKLGKQRKKHPKTQERNSYIAHLSLREFKTNKEIHKIIQEKYPDDLWVSMANIRKILERAKK